MRVNPIESRRTSRASTTRPTARSWSRQPSGKGRTRNLLDALRDLRKQEFSGPDDVMEELGKTS
jgi:hypothetical protein